MHTVDIAFVVGVTVMVGRSSVAGVVDFEVGGMGRGAVAGEAWVDL
jgi:hypothetical protein